jgi:hypothetical protein
MTNELLARIRTGLFDKHIQGELKGNYILKSYIHSNKSNNYSIYTKFYKTSNNLKSDISYFHFSFHISGRNQGKKSTGVFHMKNDENQCYYVLRVADAERSSIPYKSLNITYNHTRSLLSDYNKIKIPPKSNEFSAIQKTLNKYFDEIDPYYLNKLLLTNINRNNIALEPIIQTRKRSSFPLRQTNTRKQRLSMRKLKHKK